MKKVMMIVAMISLSIFLSDLSFAQSKKPSQRKGVISTTVDGAANVGGAAIKSTKNITRSVIKAL
ncbi:MAG: hypothetical protein EBY16_07335 [Gammaproteobacteria bacterium]|nr:hypothetical protein [Gammaproteobacteria bacterium]